MKKITIYCFFILALILFGSNVAHGQNLIPHWGADDLGLNQKEVANTQMYKWGWYCTASGYNWGTANIGAGNIRYCDAPVINGNAKKNGEAYEGRFAQVRWDGAAGNVSAYTVLGYGDGTATTAGTPAPIQLEEGKRYNFSFWRYGDAKTIYVKMFVTTDPTGADEGKTIATMDIDDKSTSHEMSFFKFDFVCPATDGYYLVFKYDSGGSKILYMGEIDLRDANIPIAADATNIALAGFTANWSAAPDAGSYQLDVATDKSFTNFVTGYENKSITGTSEAVTGLTNGVTYYYRVRAVVGSVAGENSNAISVTTLAVQAPDAPVVSDATGITHNGFVANWNNVTGAISYRLDVATDSEFTQLVAPYNDYTVTTTSQDIKGLNPNATYYYRVRAYNGSVSENSNTADLKTQKLYIVLLAGQSNMAGRGNYAQLAPADTVTYSNVLSLDRDLNWVRAKHPLHWDKSEAGVGMGITFAHELAEKMGGDVAIGLVPCAAGGTSIGKWLEDFKFEYTGNFNLYTNLIKRANKAAESGNIIGMMWHQGEGDAGDSNAYLTYLDKMQTLFNRVRKDLNMPYMPIVVGELGDYLSYARLAEINAAINELPTVMINSGAVDTKGLTPNSDKVHFTANSQLELGKRYADVFYPILANTMGTLASLTVDGRSLSPAYHPNVSEYTCYVPAGVNIVTLHAATYNQDDQIDGTGTIDVSSGSEVKVITVTTDGVAPKTYTINFVANQDIDYTHLVINNDFELAPDPADCGKSIAIADGIDGWLNGAWRPRESTCGTFYGWTFDVDFSLLTNNSQGVNNASRNKNGNWGAWIGGNYALPNEIHEFYQVIDKDQLPAGTYKVQCRMGVQHSKITTQRMFANNSVQYHGNKYLYLSNQIETEHRTFADHSTGEDDLREMVVYATIGEEEPLKIGIRTGNKKSDGSVAAKSSPMWGWFKVDYFRLTKVDPVYAANATLANITLSVGTVEDFSPEKTSYSVLLPKGTTSVTPTVVASVQEATITGAETVDLSLGSGVSTIKVTALDGTTKTYTIIYGIEDLGSGIEQVSAKAACFVADQKLTVTGADAYTVYNINGIKVADVKYNLSETPITLLPGIYVVKTDTAETFKVIVK